MRIIAGLDLVGTQLKRIWISLGSRILIPIGLSSVVPAKAGTHIPAACDYGFPLARERQRSRGCTPSSLAEPRERVGGEAAARVDGGEARLHALDPGLGRRARCGEAL